MLSLFPPQVSREVFFPTATFLRRHPAYYTYYCVYLNTLFASLVPLALLLFFNVNTLLSLRAVRQFQEADCNSGGQERVRWKQ